MQFALSAVATAVAGTLFGPDVIIDSVTIDSRAADPGALFVPIVADRDGHDFVEDAIRAGAAAHLFSRGAPAGSAIEVQDTAIALADLGRWARQNRIPELIGVTGSVGKTTAKDLIRAALGASRTVHASWRSFNNELGVPLTILNAPDAVEVVVAEMGARGAGHIATLCDIAHPTIGVVLCVGEAHTELFGDVDAVGRAKGELIEALPRDGTAILNADDARVAAMAERTDAAIVTFGSAGDVRAESVTLDDQMRPSFRLRSPWGDAPVRLATAGAHNVTNALAAVAATMVAGGRLGPAVDALGEASISPWRMEISRTSDGALVMNDAYNANPVSMAAAIDALLSADATRRIAVLGIMAELGAESRSAHRAVGDRLAAEGVTVIAVGAPDYGGVAVAGVAEAVDALGQIGAPGAGDAVLVKGSRTAGLEAVAQHLIAGA